MYCIFIHNVALTVRFGPCLLFFNPSLYRRANSTQIRSSPLLSSSLAFQQVRGVKKLVRVVLTDNIPNFGQKGEEKLAAWGFCRDTLFPHNLAVYATPDALQAYEEDRSVRIPSLCMY